MPLYLIATKWRLITGLRQSMKTLRMRTVAVTFVKKTTRWNSIRKRSFSCNSRTQQFGSWRGNEMEWNEVWSVKCDVWSVKCEVWSVIIQVHICTKFWGSKRNSSWNKWYNCHACALGSSLLTFSRSASKKSGGFEVLTRQGTGRRLGYPRFSKSVLRKCTPSQCITLNALTPKMHCPNGVYLQISGPNVEVTHFTAIRTRAIDYAIPILLLTNNKEAIRRDDFFVLISRAVCQFLSVQIDLVPTVAVVPNPAEMMPYFHGERESYRSTIKIYILWHLSV